jgi:hypothetical protein
MAADIIAKSGILKSVNEISRLKPIIVVASIFERGEMLPSFSQLASNGPNHRLLCSMA